MGMILQGFSEKSLKLAMKLSKTKPDSEERGSGGIAKNASPEIKKRPKSKP